MRPVSGLAILSLNPSLQMKLTDDYAAGNTDAHKSPVDERYRLWVLKKGLLGSLSWWDVSTALRKSFLRGLGTKSSRRAVALAVG